MDRKQKQGPLPLPVVLRDAVDLPREPPIPRNTWIELSPVGAAQGQMSCQWHTSGSRKSKKASKHSRDAMSESEACSATAHSAGNVISIPVKLGQVSPLKVGKIERHNGGNGHLPKIDWVGSGLVGPGSLK